MSSINMQLKRLEAENKSIRVGLIGAGLMGKGMVSQIIPMKGMIPAIIASNKIEDGVLAYTLAGIPKSEIIITDKISETNLAMEKGKFIVTGDWRNVTSANLVDVVVDATGIPDVGANIAMESIFNKKHIVMVNVESDITVGPILNKLAKNAGVIYTGSAGDEPGSVQEIYDFADALGFDILAIGKGKNNPIDFDATPDTVREKAMEKNLKPLRLASFVDGTNTMVEMAAMANATGFIPDIRGGHGVKSDVKNLPRVFSLKEEGGILNKYKVVDYVHGIAPGVFVVVTTKLPQIHEEMKYLSMGDGPNYVLYRPYHLTSLETPITIARAVIYNEATIVPMGKPVAEVITKAKKDLNPGDRLDGIGEYTILGSIESYERAKEEKLLPIGLVNKNTIVKKPIRKGDYITYDMVDLDKSTMIYKLRELQDQMM